MANQHQLTLFGETLWLSPYVLSSFVALTEKELPFELHGVALWEGEHLEAAYRDASLTAKVPSLDHNGFRIAESSAIAEYLDEAFFGHGRPLFPKDVQNRARARQLMAWLRSDLMALRDECPTVTIFYDYNAKPLTPAGQRDVDKLLRIATALVRANQSLFGDWSLVDIELALMLQRLLSNGINIPSALHAYAEREWHRPSARIYIDRPRAKEVPDSYWTFGGTPRMDVA